MPWLGCRDRIMRPYDTEDPLAVDCFAGRTKLLILTPLTHSTTACWSVGPVTFVSLARCAMSREAALETILPAYEALLGELVSLGVSQTGSSSWGLRSVGVRGGWGGRCRQN